MSLGLTTSDSGTGGAEMFDMPNCLPIPSEFVSLLPALLPALIP